MSRNVFILGAGASAESGAPLMRDFLDKAEDMMRLNHAGNDQEKYQLIFEGRSALLRTHSKSQSVDIYNMEAVFSAFEMGKMLGRLAELPADKVEKLAPAYKTVIAKTLEHTIFLPVVGNQVRPPKPYDSFVTLIQSINEATKAKTSVLTFNYDLGIDYALNFNGKEIDYGLKDEQRSPDAIRILKLHGSLNWIVCQKCQLVRPWYLRDYTRKYGWNGIGLGREYPVNLTLSSHLDNFEHCNTRYTGAEPVLVPPTWNKSVYHSGLESVWKHAAAELSEAENIFVVGYSLPETDVFFQYLFSLGVTSQHPLRRFWVFDPAPEVKDRYLRLLGNSVKSRFQFFEQTFSQAIGTLHRTQF